jgi:hypothetical protein
MSTGELWQQSGLVGLWHMSNTEDANTKLLLHLNGADDAVATTDVAAGKAMSFVGTAKLDTAQSAFGSASLLLDGNSDYLTTPHNADFAFGTGDFTIDLRVRFASVNGEQVLLAHWANPANDGWRFMWSKSNNYLLLESRVGGSTNVDAYATWAPSADTWYHLAVTRSGTTFKIFVDGTDITTGGGSDAAAMGDSAGLLYVGCDFVTGSAANFTNGWLDEVRIVKGVAKWTTAFTSPTAPYCMGGEDSSNNGILLTDNGTVTFGRALLGDGANLGAANSAKYLSTTSTLGIDGGVITMMGWFRILGTGAAAQCMLTQTNNTSKVMNRIVLYNNTTVSFQRYKVGGDNNEIAATIAPGNMWHWYCHVYDGTNVLGYLDGSLLGTVAASGNGASNDTAGFLIGARATPDLYFQGDIDEVAVFNRAWTFGEIKNYYSWAKGRMTKLL